MKPFGGTVVSKSGRTYEISLDYKETEVLELDDDTVFHVAICSAASR